MSKRVETSELLGSRSLKLESIRPPRPYILSVLKILAPKPLNVYSIGAILKILDPDTRYVYSIYLELPGGRFTDEFRAPARPRESSGANISHDTLAPSSPNTQLYLLGEPRVSFYPTQGSDKRRKGCTTKGSIFRNNPSPVALWQLCFRG
jgi:hypothetical protein